MRGLEDQINNSQDQIESKVTLDDFSSFMQALLNPKNCGQTNFIAITRFVGWVTTHLKRSYFKYGKQKLPRKLKKRVYLTHKLRKQYLPEYYGK